MTDTKKLSIALYHGDCIQGMRRFVPDGSVDIVVTSPPYNLGTKYSSYDDNKPVQEYMAFLDLVVLEVRRVLAPGGSFFLNVGGKPTEPWLAMDVARLIRNRMILQNTIHWIKAISVDDASFGHYKPINSERFLNDTHEFVFHFTKDGNVPLDRLSIGVPYQDKSNITRWAGVGEDKRCRGNVWFVPYETIQRRERDRPHPATFPPKLAEMCAKVHGLKPGGVVMDPFMGIGSTAIGVLGLAERIIGFDIDLDYLHVAERRLSTLQCCATMLKVDEQVG